MESEPVGLQDMIYIDKFDIDAIHDNLKLRFEKDQIYTYIGSIIVSVNPYKVMRSLYTLRLVQQYIGQRIGTLPPHIFAIADHAYSSVIEHNRNQTIIISGESGAGKTEATKLIIQFLSARTTEKSGIERKIIQTSPILEAFGNAKTVRNDNSSRFGKYMTIQLDGKYQICGTRIQHYLLEKSRVFHQAVGECNFHIFYIMLEAPSEEKKDLIPTIQKGKAEDFRYLTNGSLNRGDSSEKQTFSTLADAMNVVGLSPTEQSNIWHLLSCTLLLGNVSFKKTGKGDNVTVANSDVVKEIATGLEIQETVFEKSLTQRINIIRGEKFVTSLNETQSKENRDGLAKLIYSTLFSWIIDRINFILEGRAESFSIGVLDIFGFENFSVNSLEQLAINHTNEALQQIFNKFIFQLEQSVYEEEQINWESIKFQDNKQCLALITQKPIGLISLLDEECRFPKGTDETFLEKINKQLVENPHFKAYIKKPYFGIQHYAGLVNYTVDKFLDKNRDTVQDELLDLLIGSRNPFISVLFEKEKPKPPPSSAPLRSGLSRQNSPVSPQLARQSGAQKKAATSLSKFNDQLTSLVEVLSGCQHSYIRCIKPNMTKVSSEWDPDLVKTQLKYSGMLETISIRAKGYPVRMPHIQFENRYLVLLPKEEQKALLGADTKMKMDTFGKHLSIPDLQIGKTKVFMKEEAKVRLEAKRDSALFGVATKIQSLWRGYKDRTYFVKVKRATMLAQRVGKGWIARRQLFLKREAVTTIANAWRTHRASQQLNLQKDAVRVFQCLIRKQLAQTLHKELWEEELERREEERRRKEEEARRLEEERRRKEEEERLERERVRLEEQKKKAAEEERKRIEEERLRLEEEARKKEEERKQEELRRQEEERKRQEEAEKKRLERERQKREREERERIEREKEAEELRLREQQREEYESEQRRNRLKDLGVLADISQFVFHHHQDDEEESHIQLPPQIVEDPDDILPLPSMSSVTLPKALADPVPFIVPEPILNPPQQSNPLPAPILKEEAPIPEPILKTNDPIPEPILNPADTVEPEALPEPIVYQWDNFDDKEEEEETEEYYSFGAPDPAVLNVGVEDKIGIVVSTKPLPVIVEESDEATYNWVNYVKATFKRKASLKSKEPLESWSAKKLPDKSLNDLKEAKKLRAEVIYQKIKAFTGEKKSKESEETIIKFMCSEGISSKSLRNEIFCQLLKHTYNNPSIPSKVKGWQLMTFLVSVMIPTDPILLNVLYVRAQTAARDHTEDLTTRQELVFLLTRLKRTVQNGNRAYPPSSEEINALQGKLPLRFKVMFSNSSSRTLFVDSATTIGEAQSVLIKKLELKNYSGFNFFEVHGKLSKQIPANFACADVISKAESIRSLNSKIVSSVFFRKVGWNCFQAEWPDQIERDLVYHQSTSDVSTGRYPVSEKHMIQLAGMSMQYNFGNFSSSRDFKNLILHYINPKWYETKPQDTWVDILSYSHQLYTGYSKEEIQTGYLQLVQSTPLFGADIFPKLLLRTTTTKENLPLQFDLAINHIGLFILDDIWNISLSLKYEELQTASRHTNAGLLLLQTIDGQIIEFGPSGSSDLSVNAVVDILSSHIRFHRKSCQSVKALKPSDVDRDDPSLLDYREGDMIKVLRPPTEEYPNWLYGQIEDRKGLVMTSAVQFLAGDRHLPRGTPLSQKPPQNVPPEALEKVSDTQLLPEIHRRKHGTFRFPQAWQTASHQHFQVLPVFDLSDTAVPSTPPKLFSSTTSPHSPSSPVHTLNASITSPSSSFRTQLKNQLSNISFVESDDSFNSSQTSPHLSPASTIHVPPKTEPSTPEELRQRAIEELISTEKDYINDLRILATYYYEPMLNTRLKIFASEDMIKKTFSNFLDITLLNKRFLPLLEKASHDSSGKSIGELFLQLYDEFKIYATFCTNHNVFLHDTGDKLRQNPNFHPWEEEQKSKIPDPRKRLHLQDFLIKPVQRITKYPLMLETLLKQVPDNEEAQKSLKSAIECMNQLVNYINEKTREMDSENRVSKLVDHLDSSTLNIKEVLGKLFYIELSCKTNPKLDAPDIKLYLFEDLLFLCKIKKKEKLACYFRVGFGSLTLIDIADQPPTHMNAFEIQDKAKPDAPHRVYLTSMQEKKNFNEAYSQAQKSYYVSLTAPKKDEVKSPDSISRSRSKSGSSRLLVPPSISRSGSKGSLARTGEPSSQSKRFSTMVTDTSSLPPELAHLGNLNLNASSQSINSSHGTFGRATLTRKVSLSKGTLRKEIPSNSVDTLFQSLQWTNKPLKGPLLELSASLQSKSKETFKNIMTFMGDLPSKNKKARIKAAQELLATGIAQLELRDEIYLQIIHQLRDNPHREHEIRGWQLLYFAFQSFPFHSDSVEKVVNDLFKHNEETELTYNIEYCKTLFEWQTVNALFRTAPVTTEEVLAAEEEKETFAIKVWMLNGTSKSLYITGLSTGLIVTQDLAQKFELKNLSEWGLFEHHRPSDSSRPISESSILCDYLYSWSKTKKPEEFVFLWKRRMLIDPASDIEILSKKIPLGSHIIAQIENDLVKGHLPIEPNVSHEVIALILFLQYGSFGAVDLKSIKVSNFCPRHFSKLPKFSATSWVKEVVEAWKNLGKLSPEDAQIQLIERVKDNSLYGTYIFTITYKKKTKWLIFSRSGIHITEPHKTEPEETFHYYDIATWSGGKETFKMEYGNLMDPEKITFSGPQATGIEALINVYMNTFYH